MRATTATIPSMDAIYQELVKRDLCASLNDFQTSWMGVHPNYLARVKSRKLKPRLPVLVKLYATLLDRYQPDLAEKVRLEMLAMVL